MFWTSLPATAQAFSNRSEELTRVEQAARALHRGRPKWLAILGPRKIGKTSLILEAARRSEMQDVRYVVLDALQDAPITTEFFRRYALVCLHAALAAELEEDLELLARVPADYRAVLVRSEGFVRLPADLRRLALDLPEMELTRAAIRACLEFPEKLAAACKTRLMVAIDEFQELDDVRSSRKRLDPFGMMRSLWQKHKRTSYIISGSGRSMLRSLIADKQAPFFQHFSVMELGPFERTAAIALLTESTEEDAIPRAIAERMVDVIGGHPFYLQILGDALTRQDPPYDAQTLKVALQEELFSRTGRISLYFQNEFDRVVGRSGQLASVLDALADGPKRLSALASQLGVATGATVRLLERLADAVIKQPSGQYALDDSLFGQWLQWRRPGGAVVPMTLVGDAAEQAVARQLALLGFELVYQSRASRGAFDLLAIRGGVQLGVQVKRSDLPLRFAKTTWKRMTSDARRFGWKWVVAAVSPDDEVAFLDPDRARRGKEIRLTAAGEIDNLPEWLT